MALIKYGGGIIQMSGSMAGNTFARNRFGNYLRARTKPVNPNSDRQLAARAILSAITEAWHENLSDAQRITWNTYAAAISWLNRLGETVNLTGFNHFVRSNTARLHVGAALILDGPTTLSLPSVDTGFVVNGEEADDRLDVEFDGTDGWDDEDGAWMIIHQGQPQLATHEFFGGPYRMAENLPGAPGVDPPSPVTRVSSFTLIEGQEVWCRHRILRADGRLSTLGGAPPFVVTA